MSLSVLVVKKGKAGNRYFATAITIICLKGLETADKFTSY